MIENFLTRDEGKTLEFKENTKPLSNIIRTVVAFANTAGGTLIIGVTNEKKEVVGLENILKEEERLANAIADSIQPLMTPTIQLSSWRKRDLLVIHVPYSPGPYYLKSKGERLGTYIRLGSTNRLADQPTIDSISRTKQRQSYDELPCLQAMKSDLDFELGKREFLRVSKKFTPQNARGLELLISHQGHEIPSIGGMLLFGKTEKRMQLFPNTRIRCARFKGKSKVHFLDQTDINDPLPLAVDAILYFVRKHSTVGYDIQSVRRKEVYQYPPQVIREAVINALVHADYSHVGSSIQIAIFDDRIEVTNPGCLPFGLSLETALSGFSRLRNKVIGRVFQELNLIESWGTGLNRMIEICQRQGISPPRFEEMDHYFKVTLYHDVKSSQVLEKWEKIITNHLLKKDQVTAKEAQKLWNVSSRTTSSRLKKMCEKGLIVELSTGPYDPHKIFVKQ